MECEIKRDRVILSLLQFEATAILKDLERLPKPSYETEEVYKRLLKMKGKVK
jgi:hypothetical protein